MRVTKIIKDYIISEVDKKYKEKLNSFKDDYQEDLNRMENELEQFRKECDEKAKKIIDNYGMELTSNYNIFDIRTYHIKDKERDKKRIDFKENLRQERNDKIAQIILDLELGETTKKELQSVLSKIEF